MSHLHLPAMSRRRFLTAGGAAAAGAVLLGACGDDDSGSRPTTDDGGTDTSGPRGLALAQFFGGPTFVAGTALRAPFGVADQDGLLTIDDTPEELEVVLLDADDAQVGDAVTVVRHAEGLPRAYFPLITTLDAPGIYTARTELDGEPAEMALEVKEASAVKVIQVGAPMPALETPTVTDARGVTPICTADPVCSLHQRTVAEGLTSGTPLAVLVSTPGHCQIAICGPVLDVLLGAADSHPDVEMFHLEVYADYEKDSTLFAPAPGALGLHFEPCLVLVHADGTVAERFDVIFDAAELDAGLSRLS